MTPGLHDRRMADVLEIRICVCGKTGTSRCSACRLAWYCSKTCQGADWQKHKKVCGKQTLRSVTGPDIIPVAYFHEARRISADILEKGVSAIDAEGFDILIQAVQTDVPEHLQAEQLAMIDELFRAIDKRPRMPGDEARFEKLKAAVATKRE
jgi:hypothetical protein